MLCSLWGAPELLGVGEAAARVLLTGLLAAAAAGGKLVVSEAKTEVDGAIYLGG